MVYYSTNYRKSENGNFLTFVSISYNLPKNYRASPKKRPLVPLLVVIKVVFFRRPVHTYLIYPNFINLKIVLSEIA